MRKAINRNKDNAFATILVLVVILVLSITVYSFANQMYLEHAATRASMRQAQARLTALSGMEWTRYQLRFLRESERSQVVIPVSSPVEPSSNSATRFEQFEATVYRSISRLGPADRNKTVLGLASESAKLNIHSLDLSKKGEAVSRSRLCSLPNMTLQMADALLDWIDVDDEPRSYGAEAGWYTQNAASHRPENGRIDNWGQLLAVRGFSEELLFGEDTNLNGWLDWNENDGDVREPKDNRNGLLEQGLVAFLSLDACEFNRDRNGKEKIYLNDANLERLFMNVASRFGEDAAAFVVSFRVDGPIRKETIYDPIADKKLIVNSLEERLDFQLTPNEKIRRPNEASVTRSSNRKGGVSFDRQPSYRIRSVVELVDSSVLTIIESEEKILTSPWNRSGAATHLLIQLLEENFTTVAGEYNFGRIDITQASLEVLLTIPGFSKSMANSLIQSRNDTLDRNGKAGIPSVYWLVENQIMDFDFLQTVAHFLTIDGAVYTGYSVGHDWVSQSASIIKFTLSCEGTSVRLLEHREVGMTPWIRQNVGKKRSN